MFIARAALFCSALVCAALPAFSQTYPTRPITMIVPFAVGGPTDTIARIMSERMGKTLGQQVIVENVTGAGGSIAVNKVARSAPDGYTVGIGHIGTHVIVEAIQPVQFDVLKDLDPVGMICTNPQLLIAKMATPSFQVARPQSTPEKFAPASVASSRASPKTSLLTPSER